MICGQLKNWAWKWTTKLILSVKLISNYFYCFRESPGWWLNPTESQELLPQWDLINSQTIFSSNNTIWDKLRNTSRVGWKNNNK